MAAISPARPGVVDAKIQFTKTAMKHAREFWLILLAFGTTVTVAIAPVSAQQQLDGQVLGADAPIANATVTLLVASADAPVELARTESGTNGRFTLSFAGVPSGDEPASISSPPAVNRGQQGSGNNPAIALMAAVGPTPPAKVDDQRDDDRGVGVDARTIPRRHGDQGTLRSA